MSRPGLFVAGGFHSLVVTERGALLAWGGNSHGQLGDGSIKDRPNPVQVLEKGAHRVGAGRLHSLLISDVGDVFAWGSNEDGLLVGASLDRRQPKPVKLIEGGFTDVAGGWHHSLALRKDGQVFAWGGNEYGQLGDGTTNTCLQPKSVFSGAVAVAAGRFHSVFLTSGGEVWVCGFIVSDQVCHSRGSPPIRVANLAGITIAKIAAGGFHCFAVEAPTRSESGGRLFAWGGNDYSQLGDGTRARRFEPVEVAEDIMNVSAGDQHSIAINSTFELYVWGYMMYGQRGGIGRWKSHIRPTLLPYEDGIHSGSCGCSHSIFLTPAGEILTSGANLVGQLGDGLGEDRAYLHMVLKAGTVEMVSAEARLKALMQAPDDLDDELIKSQELRSTTDFSYEQLEAASTIAIGKPGLLPALFCEDVLKKSDEHMRLWGGGDDQPQGYNWFGRMGLAKSYSETGFVRPGHPKPGDGDEFERTLRHQKIRQTGKNFEEACDRLAKAQAAADKATSKDTECYEALQVAKEALKKYVEDETRRIEELNRGPGVVVKKKDGERKMKRSETLQATKIFDSSVLQESLRQAQEDFRYHAEKKKNADEELDQAITAHKWAEQKFKAAKGAEKVPELLAIMEKGESDFARKVRQRAEAKREAQERDKEEAAFKLQLARVKQQAISDPAIVAIKFTPPFRVKSLEPFVKDDLMLLFKSCVHDIMRSSNNLQVGHSKMISDKALFEIMRPVWKYVLHIEGVMLTKKPKRYSPADPKHLTIAQGPWRLNFLDEGDGNWVVEELQDLRLLSDFARSQPITSSPAWLLAFYGTEGTEPRFRELNFSAMDGERDIDKKAQRLKAKFDGHPPALLQEISMMGFGAGAVRSEEVRRTSNSTRAYIFQSGPQHRDMGLMAEEVRAKYFADIDTKSEDIEMFKRRICEGLSLLQRLGKAAAPGEPQRLIERAQEALQPSQVTWLRPSLPCTLQSVTNLEGLALPQSEMQLTLPIARR